MAKKLVLITTLICAALAGFAFLRWTESPKVAGFTSDVLQEADAPKIMEYARAQNSPLVLINFWASWCEPCKQEFPHFMSVRDEYSQKGLKVIFVSLDDPPDLPAAEAFLRSQKVDFLTFHKGSQPLNLVAKIFPDWTGAVPASVLLSREGEILEAWEGDTSMEELQTRVKKHLRGS